MKRYSIMKSLETSRKLEKTRERSRKERPKQELLDGLVFSIRSQSIIIWPQPNKDKYNYKVYLALFGLTHPCLDKVS